jgi:hypothetical protein
LRMLAWDQGLVEKEEELTNCEQQREEYARHETPQDLRSYSPRLYPRETKEEMFRGRALLPPLRVPVLAVVVVMVVLMPPPPSSFSTVLGRVLVPRPPRPTPSVPSPPPSLLRQSSELALLRVRESPPLAPVLAPRPLHVLGLHRGNRLGQSGHDDWKAGPRGRRLLSGPVRLVLVLVLLCSCGTRRGPVGALRPGPRQMRQVQPRRRQIGHVEPGKARGLGRVYIRIRTVPGVVAAAGPRRLLLLPRTREAEEGRYCWSRPPRKHEARGVGPLGHLGRFAMLSFDIGVLYPWRELLPVRVGIPIVELVPLRRLRPRVAA